MRFTLLDAVVERSAERLVSVKQVSGAEEYLQDHFPGFPVLPGVFMLEALVHAGRALLGDAGRRLVLGSARAVKYGSFVRPGDTLRAEVVVSKALEGGGFELRGEATVHGPGHWAGAGALLNGNGAAKTAVSGRFVLRPVRLGTGGAGRYA